MLYTTALGKREMQATLPKLYFVIVSPSYGGAEKRFFDIFRAMRQSGVNVGLIAPSMLAERLIADHPDQEEVTATILAVPLSRWSRGKFILGLGKVLKSLPRRSSFHYPMNCLWPLHLFRNDAISLSAVYCVEPPGLRSRLPSLVWTWLSFFFVNRIDVLSPHIYKQLATDPNVHKMSLTPGGTFIDISSYSIAAKRPKVGLLSRMVPQKGIDDVLDVLPATWNRLKGRVPADFSFSLAGNGALDDHVRQRVAEFARRGIPVEFVGYASASDYLPEMAVVLSMQEITNYPSRVVAEGLVCGCGVIVRDTGDSREFGALDGLAYVKAALDADELAETIFALLTEVTKGPSRPLEIRSKAAYRFSSTSSLHYFRALMESA